MRLAALILTVVAMAALATAGTATAAPVGAPVANLALGKPTTASSSLADGQPSLAVDGNPHTAWNSGNFATQWIEIDLGAPYAVGEISLAITQLPDGFTVHRVYAKPAAGATYMRLHEFAGTTTASQVLTLDLEPAAQDVRFVRIETTVSPSWVAWREIEICSTACPKTLTLTSSTTLTEDHYGNILIHSDNVTLDCAGHTIHGPGATGISGGVDIVLSSRVTVKNCVISQFAFANGIFAAVGSNLRLENNTLVGNAASGVHVDRMVDGVVIGNTSRSNAGYGIVLTESQRMEVADNIAENNGATGVGLLSSVDIGLVGNTAFDNGADGILLQGVQRSEVVGNDVRLNGANGIAVIETMTSKLAGNTVIENGNYGFVLEGSSTIELIGNNVRSHPSDGFAIFFSHNNAIVDNESIGNVWGIGLYSSNFDLLAGNQVTHSREHGILLLDDSTGNHVERNHVVQNGLVGFLVGGGDGNTLTGNIANQNGDEGFVLTSGSTGNTLSDNRSMTNRVGFSLQEGATGNTLGQNVAHANAAIDAEDQNGPGSNTWLMNSFGTTSGIN